MNLTNFIHFLAYFLWNMHGKIGNIQYVYTWHIFSRKFRPNRANIYPRIQKYIIFGSNCVKWSNWSFVISLIKIIFIRHIGRDFVMKYWSAQGRKKCETISLQQLFCNSFLPGKIRNGIHCFKAARQHLLSRATFHF